MEAPGITLGELVRRAREKAGWSYEVMAEKCGWKKTDSFRTIKRIEAGDTNISIEKLQIVLEGAGLSLQQCLRWPGDPTPADSTVDIVSQIMNRRDERAHDLELFVLGMSKGLGVRARVAPPPNTEPAGPSGDMKAAPKRKRAG